MTPRFLWTLERPELLTRGGLDTIADLIIILAREDLPGVLPADWILATIAMDEDAEGAAVHASPLGWTLLV
ncbi:MAG: hypothetical protein KGI75_12130 [Rhizobiaceae bacterium]|nr:hypothetical protein [Rhizobiaceae bacterium]